MTPEGYWLFARAWNRVEVFAAAMACVEAGRGNWFSAALIFGLGSFVSSAGKSKYRL